MPAASLIDTIIGGCYRLLRPLGEGGMGVVYEAQHLRLGGKVAIKILSPQHAADPKLRDRFRREARAVSQIRHPNVVQITDFGETPNGSVFFAMEVLEGHDLHYILHKHAPAPFPWLRAQHLLAQATDALAAAHRVGIVHRDVKPSNIFVLEGPGLQDFVKLLDFGIAKIVAPTADSALVKNLTGTGEIFGTAKYMAPEQAYGGTQDPRMDVYSLGVVAYELLTGRVPFTGQTSFEIITRHVYDSPRPPRELRPDLPAALEAVVLRALEKKPENRFPTMEEFGQALRQRVGAGGGASTIGSSVPEARLHTDTNASTQLRDRKALLQVEPTSVVAKQAAAPGQVASVVRKTVPAFAAASSPAQAGAPVAATSPAAHPPALPFVAQPPVAHPVAAQTPASYPPAAYPPAAQPSALPPIASPTDNLARVQAPTGPLARRRGPAYDDTGRDLAVRPPAAPSRTGRLVALALIGSLTVASLSALAVVLVMKPNQEEGPTLVDARAPTLEPMVEPSRPPHDANEPGATPEESTEIIAPAPALEVIPPRTAEPVAAEPEPLRTKSPSSKSRRRSTSPPVADPDPGDKIAEQIGIQIQRKLKRDCESLGNGKEVIIELEVGRNGRISNKIIGAVGPLRACIIKAIGDPKFLPKATRLEISPVIGKCVEAYGSTVSRCK